MATRTKKGVAMPELLEVLDSLKDRRKRLDDADTQISNLIKDVEEELQAHFNIRVWTDITEHPNGSGMETLLTFGKHDGKWQLLVETEFPDGRGDKTPLLSCSRETRARAFTDGHVEALIRGAASQLDEQLAARGEAIENGTNLVRVLGGVPF